MELLLVSVKIVVVFFCLLVGATYLAWFERKVLGRIHVRCGPHRVGWQGILGPIADGIKLFFKEDLCVPAADKVIYYLSPLVMVGTACLMIAVIPFGTIINISGYPVLARIADSNISLLYILALSSLGGYGSVLAGWSSRNKYSLIGGVRSGALMISYGVPLGLSTIGVVMQTRSFSFVKIVEAQAEQGCFIAPQFIGFLVFLVCAIAECNRAPFDLAKAEEELVAGYQVEYSSTPVVFFMVAEYSRIILMSALVVTLFFGGWLGPWFIPPPLWCGPVWFGIKICVVSFIFIVLRATFPRFRFDQVIKFGWRVLFPLSLLNIALTAVVMII